MSETWNFRENKCRRGLVYPLRWFMLKRRELVRLRTRASARCGQNQTRTRRAITCQACCRCKHSDGWDRDPALSVAFSVCSILFTAAMRENNFYGTILKLSGMTEQKDNPQLVTGEHIFFDDFFVLRWSVRPQSRSSLEKTTPQGRFFLSECWKLYWHSECWHLVKCWIFWGKVQTVKRLGKFRREGQLFGCVPYKACIRAGLYRLTPSSNGGNSTCTSSIIIHSTLVHFLCRHARDSENVLFAATTCFQFAKFPNVSSVWESSFSAVPKLFFFASR